MSVTPPNDLTATSQWSDKIRLTWSNREDYEIIYVQRDSGSGFSIIDSLAGTAESYDDEDITANTSYTYRLKVKIVGDVDYSNTDACACYADTLTDTLTLSDTLVEGTYFLDTISLSDVLTELGTYAETYTDTLTLSDYLLDAQTLKTTYAYYLIDSAGNTYEHGGNYKGDAGTAIPSTFETLNTDFADQDPEVKDDFKEIFGARLHYKDLDASTVVSVSYSDDGGTTWVPDTKIIGTGDGTTKSQEFFFRAIAHTFKFKIDHASANKDFQWSALEVFYLPAGEFF